MEKLRKMFETYGHKTCNNFKKKELFSIITKLSYYKVFHKKTVGYRNEKKIKYSGIEVSIWIYQILEIRKIVTYEFWFGYVKPKYGKKTKLCVWIQTVSLYT